MELQRLRLDRSCLFIHHFSLGPIHLEETSSFIHDLWKAFNIWALGTYSWGTNKEKTRENRNQTKGPRDGNAWRSVVESISESILWRSSLWPFLWLLFDNFYARSKLGRSQRYGLNELFLYFSEISAIPRIDWNYLYLMKSTDSLSSLDIDLGFFVMGFLWIDRSFPWIRPLFLPDNNIFQMLSNLHVLIHRSCQVPHKQQWKSRKRRHL